MGLGEAKSPRSSFAGEPCTYQIIGNSNMRSLSHDQSPDRTRLVGVALPIGAGLRLGTGMQALRGERSARRTPMGELDVPQRGAMRTGNPVCPVRRLVRGSTRGTRVGRVEI